MAVSWPVHNRAKAKRQEEYDEDDATGNNWADEFCD